MTTSSSETARGPRCTRISPSAILDDRLSGRDLDWARDHLRRCDTCRDRVEDFQEMRLRLERLAQAPVSNTAIEDAFVAVVPQALRPLPSQARLVGTPSPRPPAQAAAELRSPGMETFAPPPLDVASVPDLLTELEQEIFQEDAWTRPPAGLVGEEAEVEGEAGPDAAAPQVAEPEPPFNLRQVAVESGPRTETAYSPPEPTPEVPPEAPPVPIAPDWQEALPVAIAADRQDAPPVAADPAPAGAALPSRPDTAMRLAVGLGAAGCVLLAALLYESGLFSGRPTASISPRPSTSVALSQRATSRPTVAPSTGPARAASPTAPPPVILARLGQGVAGESVFRIRPGTANPTWTRLVFDLTGGGLPTMVIAQPDALHLQVTFLNTTGAGVPVGGIHSRQVTGIEPAVQQGNDLVITVDLAAPMRLNDFTLPPEQGYAPRLVLDIHSQ
jgi:hypothetical protein